MADEVARELANNSDGATAAGEALHEPESSRLPASREAAGRFECSRRATSPGGGRAARLEHGRLEQELRVRETLTSEAQSRDERTRAELAAATEQLADVQSQLTPADSHDRLRQETAAEIEQLTTENGRSKSQRRRAAREFKRRHAAQVAELEEQQAQLAQLQEALAQATAEQERLMGELRKSAGPRGADIEELQTAGRARRSGPRAGHGQGAVVRAGATVGWFGSGARSGQFRTGTARQRGGPAEARSQAERPGWN